MPGDSERSGSGQAYVFLQTGKFALTGGVAKWVAGNV